MKTCAAAATTRTAALGAALSVLVAAPAGAWQCDSLEICLDVVPLQTKP